MSFNLQNNAEIQSNLIFSTGGMEEYSNESTAGARTYCAFRHLPDNQGLYGFISLTLDAKEDNYNINPCNVDETELRQAKTLRRLHTGSIFTCAEPSEREMEDFYINNVEQKISGDVTKMFKDLEAVSAASETQCWKAQSEPFYFKELLNHIDREIQGHPSEDHKLVKFLVSRLGEDLKRVPRMNYIMDLPVEQRQLKILEILRQKLVLR